MPKSTSSMPVPTPTAGDEVVAERAELASLLGRLLARWWLARRAPQTGEPDVPKPATSAPAASARRVPRRTRPN